MTPELQDRGVLSPEDLSLLKVSLQQGGAARAFGLMSDAARQEHRTIISFSRNQTLIRQHPQLARQAFYHLVGLHRLISKREHLSSGLLRQTYFNTGGVSAPVEEAECPLPDPDSAESRMKKATLSAARAFHRAIDDMPRFSLDGALILFHLTGKDEITATWLHMSGHGKSGELEKAARHALKRRRILEVDRPRLEQLMQRS